jgi:hypothetical protein
MKLLKANLQQYRVPVTILGVTYYVRGRKQKFIFLYVMVHKIFSHETEKYGSWFPLGTKPRMTVLATANSNLLDRQSSQWDKSVPSRGGVASSSQTPPLVEEEAPFFKKT